MTLTTRGLLSFAICALIASPWEVHSQEQYEICKLGKCPLEEGFVVGQCVPVTGTIQCYGANYFFKARKIRRTYYANWCFSTTDPNGCAPNQMGKQQVCFKMSYYSDQACGTLLCSVLVKEITCHKPGGA